MYIPGFEISNLSDDELLNKQQDIARKLSYLSAYGGAPEAISQLRAMSSAIDAERMERIYSEAWEARQKIYPAVIESDPTMRDSVIATDDKKPTVPKKTQQSVSIMRRTATPVIDNEDK